MSLNLKSLIGRLNDTSRRALEGAAGLCVSRTHYEVELEHWLAKLLEGADSDLPRVLRKFDIDPSRFLRDLTRVLDTFKTGNSRRPDLSETIETLARDAWVLASINFGLSKVRSGTLFLAALSNMRLRRRLIDIHGDIRNINVEALEQGMVDIVGGSVEDREISAISAGTERGLAQPGSAATGTATPSLDQFTIDLTLRAREGKIDPVLGRDHEIRQIIDILTRKRQNNPILTGEAGVGKTAVVEGFAQKIALGDVPEPLQGVALRTLDLGLLQAGAGVKGEFENRLKQVIEEVRGSAQPIILFIDEAHTMIGAGGQAGQNDAANLLKPALARGELRTVAATTWAEYKKYFEKDPALSRRFQVVRVEEPDEQAAIQMMRGMAKSLEAHHRVPMLDEAVVDSVRLSHRYIPARQLPDKCMSVLDTACARVSMAQHAVPASVEDVRRRIQDLSREHEILSREQVTGADHGARLREIEQARSEAEEELGALEKRWAKEKELAGKIHEVRNKLVATISASAGEGETAEASAPSEQEISAARGELNACREELRKLQGESPLVLLDVDGQAIAEVISGWTGIPIGKMVADEIKTILTLADLLRERVIGQDHALSAIARRIHTSRASLDNPSRPVGVFLLVGPSGVGKTESALALADSLYGGERNAISINMSEFQEAHTVSSLKGSPPGYVGYGEGGVLTEAVRRRPHAVVLLDEVEKAHPDVMELFFQVFDKGVLEDGEGREIDFKNTVIILTSNVGTDTIMSLAADPETMPDPEVLTEAVRPDLLRVFPAALLGRMITVPFYPLSVKVLRQIIRLQIERIQKRMAQNHGAELVYGDDLVEAVEARCNEAESGARAVDRILTHSLLPEMAAEVLSRMAQGESFSRIEVALEGPGAFTFNIS